MKIKLSNLLLKYNELNSPLRIRFSFDVISPSYKTSSYNAEVLSDFLKFYNHCLLPTRFIYSTEFLFTFRFPVFVKRGSAYPWWSENFTDIWERDPRS